MAKPPMPLLGRIALHLKLIDVDRLAEATRAQGQASNEKRLGEILVERGMLTPAQLEQVLRARQQLLAKQRAKRALAEALPEPEPAAPRGSAGPQSSLAHREARGGASRSDPRSEPQASEGEARGDPVRGASRSDPRSEPQASEGEARGDPELLALLRHGIERGASDVHVHAATPRTPT